MPGATTRTVRAIDERLLTVRDLSAWLGYGIDSIQRMVREDGLPGFKVGRRLRFRKADVERWLQANSTLRARKAS